MTHVRVSKAACGPGSASASVCTWWVMQDQGRRPCEWFGCVASGNGVRSGSEYQKLCMPKSTGACLGGVSGGVVNVSRGCVGPACSVVRCASPGSACPWCWGELCEREGLGPDHGGGGWGPRGGCKSIRGLCAQVSV